MLEWNNERFINWFDNLKCSYCRAVYKIQMSFKWNHNNGYGSEKVSVKYIWFFIIFSSIYLELLQ